MKKTMAFIAAALALFMALGCMPLSLAVHAKTVTPCWTVPAGYNAHDYNACAAFLEQADENGVKNGEKLSETYDPNDPETWGMFVFGYYDENDEYVTFEEPRFSWTSVNGELRLFEVYAGDADYDPEWGLVGSLDLSDCTELMYLQCDGNFIDALDVTGCVSLCDIEADCNRLTELDISDCEELFSLFCGDNELTSLDVSNCPELSYLHCPSNRLTELDVSNCPELDSLICFGNLLNEIDVSCNPALTYLDVDDNRITSLDIANNSALEYLYCSWNELTELNVSANPALTVLFCYNNLLTELDLSNNTELSELYCIDNPLVDIVLPGTFPVQRLSSEGRGAVGCTSNDTEGVIVSAYPGVGAEFIGWYDEAGMLVSEEDEFYLDGGSYAELIARFEGGALPGDVNGDGSAAIDDALLAMRYAMGLISLTDEQLECADVNGDGDVAIDDALIIMRAAMGLISLD